MKINFHSSEWEAVFEYASKQIAEHTAELMSFNCDARKADYLRGQIESLKSLIANDVARYKEFSIKLP